MEFHSGGGNGNEGGGRVKNETNEHIMCQQ